MTQRGQSRPSAGVFINLGLIIGGLFLVALVVLIRMLPGDGDSGEPIDLAIQLEPVAAGLDGPVLLTGAGDGSARVEPDTVSAVSKRSAGTRPRATARAVRAVNFS